MRCQNPMRTRAKRWLYSSAFLPLSAAFAVTVAYAHSMYQSDVMLDFVGDKVHVELVALP